MNKDAQERIWSLEMVSLLLLISVILLFMIRHKQQKQIALTIDLPDHLPNLIVDEIQTIKIIGNLVSNAIKFSSSGSTITISGATNIHGLDLIVTDTGEGIEEEQIEEIIKPFAHVAAAYTNQHDGMGVGLSISSKLMKEYGGLLSISSKVEQGTAVTLHFPVDRLVYPSYSSLNE